ncbi:MAG: PEGA domain-containing protein [Patescibacteria group bacterium]
MKIKAKQIFFPFFIFVFLVTAPLVVLYTAGYRYSTSLGMVVQTGILSIESLPKGATIVIDSKIQNEKTPAILDNIVPGEHLIKIVKDGYLSWEDNIEVNSRQTTFIKNAVLFSNAPAVASTFSNSEMQTKISTKINPNNLFFQKIINGLSLNKVNSNGQNIVIAYVPSGSYTFFQSPNSLITIQKTQDNQLYVIDENKSDLPILLSVKAEYFQWEESDDPRLLYSDGFDINIYDPKIHSTETLTRFSDQITGLTWHPKRTSVLFTKKQSLLALEIGKSKTVNRYILEQGDELRDVWADGKNIYFFGRIKNTRGWFEKPLED